MPLIGYENRNAAIPAAVVVIIRAKFIMNSFFIFFTLLFA